MQSDLEAMLATNRVHERVIAETIGMVIKELVTIKPSSRSSLAAGLTAIGQSFSDDEVTAGKIMLGNIARSAGMA